MGRSSRTTSRFVLAVAVLLVVSSWVFKGVMCHELVSVGDRFVV